MYIAVNQIYKYKYFFISNKINGVSGIFLILRFIPV